MAEKYAVVYNSTSDVIVADGDIQTHIPPQEWRAVQRSKVQDSINAGHLIVIDTSQVTHLSNPVAIAAKDEYNRLTKEWEDEKAVTSADADKEATMIADEPDKTAQNIKGSKTKK